MADIASLVKQYLGPTHELKRLNYYTLFGLDELIDDRTAIAIAVESAIEKLKLADRKADPAGFEQIVKVVRQARATLLDEDKKQAYDKQLRSSSRKSSESAKEVSAGSSEVIRLQALLPTGDPSAPFSMSDFLRQPVPEDRQESASERHLALTDLARQSATPTKEASSANKHGPPLSQDFPAAPQSNNSARELQTQIRRNRQKKNTRASIIAVGVSLLFVGAAGLMYWQSVQVNRKQLGANQTQVDALEPRIELREPSLQAPSKPSTNKGAGAKNRMDLGGGGDGSTEALGSLPKINLGNTTVEDAMTSNKQEEDGKQAMAPPESPSKPMAEIDKPNEPDSEMVKMEAAAKKWSETMTSARKAIESRDFEKFTTFITEATDLSATDEQIEKCKKLDTLGQLFEQSQDFIKQEISKLKSSEVISVGQSTQVSIVEVKENEIILRGKSAKNETYAFDKLPIGFVESLLNLQLGDSPMHDAIRGVFFLLDVRSNPVTKKRAQEYFDKAALADPKFDGLSQAMTEKY